MMEIDNISNKTADRILGIFLIVCATLGTYGNALSLVFFKNQKSNSGNRLFYQKFHTIISGVDLVICVAQIPVIQSLIVGREKDSLFFQEDTICYAWGGLWAIVQPLSFYSITALSYCKLFALMNPYKRLPLYLPCRFLLASIMALFLLTTVPAFSEHFNVYYNEKQVHCFLSPKRPVEEDSEYDTQIALFSIVRASFLCLPILPILLSFVMTVHHIRRVEKFNFKRTPTTRSRRHETRTVQILTFVCLICSIPVVFYEIYLALMFSNHSNPVLTQLQQRDSYLGFVAQDVLTTIKSTIYPIIYLIRVKSFRQYVGEWKHARKNIVSRISTISLSAKRSSMIRRLSKLPMLQQLNSRLSFSVASNASNQSGIEHIPELDEREKDG